MTLVVRRCHNSSLSALQLEGYCASGTQLVYDESWASSAEVAPCITLFERQVLGFAVELIGPRPFDGRRTQFGRHSVVQPGAITAFLWRIRRAGGTSVQHS